MSPLLVIKLWTQNCTPLAVHAARVLCLKFSFLLKVIQGNNSLSCGVFRSLAASEVESIQLVHQCRFLESQYGSNLTSDILTDPMSFSTAALKKDILWLYRSRPLADASTAPHLKHIVWMLTPIQSATGSEFGTLPLIVDPMAHLCLGYAEAPGSSVFFWQLSLRFL